MVFMLPKPTSVQYFWGQSDYQLTELDNYWLQQFKNVDGKKHFPHSHLIKVADIKLNGVKIKKYHLSWMMWEVSRHSNQFCA